MQKIKLQCVNIRTLHEVSKTEANYGLNPHHPVVGFLFSIPSILKLTLHIHPAIEAIIIDAYICYCQFRSFNVLLKLIK